MLEGISQEQTIKDALTKLNLEGMLTSLEEINRRAIQNKVTYIDFLESLLEHEFEVKEGKQEESWIKQAGFPFLSSLEEFNFSIPKLEIDKQLIYELASCRYIEKAENIIFYGPPGVGKTHLTVALARKAIQRAKRVKFLKLPELIKEIEKILAKGGNTHEFLVRLLRPHLLIIDDMENLETSPEVNTFLYSLIEHRHGKGSMIFISNEAFTQFHDLFGGPKRTGKAIERIFHYSHIVRIKGDSQRLKDKKIN